MHLLVAAFGAGGARTLVNRRLTTAAAAADRSVSQTPAAARVGRSAGRRWGPSAAAGVSKRLLQLHWCR